ncbi:MAG: hypothetical protein HY275_04825 [Gemmatimonadetes bacterium]|nr:hypothetical protein [Gemmatimonadota bacterium]
MTRFRLLATLVMILPSWAAPRSMGAQTDARVSVVGGTATDGRGATSNAITLAPSLSFGLAAATTLSLGGSATWFQNGSWSAGLGLALADRRDLGAGFAATNDFAVSGTHMSFDANLLVAEMTPAVEWSRHGVTLYGGGHAAVGYASVASTPPAALPLLPPGAKTLVTATRSALAPVYGAQWRLPIPPDVLDVTLGYREEPMVVNAVAVTDRTGSMAVSIGRLRLSGLAGVRDAADEPAHFSSGTAALELTRTLSLTVSGGTYPSNRLSGAAGGQYTSVGLSMRVGGGAPGDAVSSLDGAPPPAPGTTRFLLIAKTASRVEFGGDFNDWTWIPATRAPNGAWYVDARLAPGSYRCAFRIDGTEWRSPEGVTAVDDGFGGKSAYVTIRDTDHPAQSHH